MDLENLSQLNKNIVLAYKNGYRVDTVGVVRNSKGEVRKLTSRSHKGSKGYLYFTWRSEGKHRVVYIHKLQAYQKFGEKMFEDGILVRHKDGNSMNNNYGNILIGTASQNQFDRNAEERKQHGFNASQHIRVWSDDVLKEIFDDRYRRGYSYSMLKDKYGMSKGHCSWTFHKSLYSKKYDRDVA